MSTTNRLTGEHQVIWREFHAPAGVTLGESKRDWLDLLRDDPEMADPANWGALAGTTTERERSEFETWLLDDDDLDTALAIDGGEVC